MAKLNEIGNFKTGYMLSRYKSEEKTENKYQVLTLKSLEKYGKINKNELDEIYLEKSIDEEFLTREGDIIIRLRTPIVASLITKETENIIVPSLMAIYRVNNENVLNGYMSTCINSSEVKKSLVSRVSGTAIPSVTIADLKEIEINMPNLKIQESVINFSENMKTQLEILEKLIESKEIFYRENLKKILENM